VLLSLFILLIVYGGWRYNQLDDQTNSSLYHERILTAFGRENPTILSAGNCASHTSIEGKRRPPFDNPGSSLSAELEQLCLQLHYTSLPPPISHVDIEDKPDLLVDDIIASVLTTTDKQIHRLSLIHTLPPVLSPEECKWVIDASEKHTKVRLLVDMPDD